MYLDENTSSAKKAEVYKRLLELIKIRTEEVIKQTELIEKMSNETDER